MAEQVACPLCGTLVSRRGLGSHKWSAPCRAASTVRRYQEQGYDLFRLRYRSLAERLQQAGWVEDIREDISRWTPGWRGRPGFYTNGLYVRPGERMARLLQAVEYLRARPALACELTGLRPPRTPWHPFAKLVDVLVARPEVWERVQVAMALEDAEGS